MTDPIAHLEDDDLMCRGFAVEIECAIAVALMALPPDMRRHLSVVYCKVCDETYRWVAVLTPRYEQAHRYRRHPDRVCTFETLGSVDG
jgi:hypothetical protein